MIDLSKLPTNPGCYIYKNKDNQIIYIGKAKNLKKRVNTYFSREDLDPKTSALVSNISSVDFIVTNTEMEALLLENNLIKKNKPKYNIELKDSREYTYLKLTTETFPRLVILREKPKSNEIVFGPFTSSQDRDYILKFVNKEFMLRTCKKLPKVPCIRYHIGHCTAPCINKITEEDYNKTIKNVSLLLSGKTKDLLVSLKKEMNEYAFSTNFEKAKVLRDQIKGIEYLSEKQNVEKQKSFDQDIINYTIVNNKAYFILFNISKGLLINKQEFIQDIFEEDILDEFIIEHYTKQKELPKEVILPHNLNQLTIDFFKNQNIKLNFIIPKSGEKKELLLLSKKNIEVTLLRNINSLELLKENLFLQEIPRIIECFDISHLSGTLTVASMVQFVDGKENKQGYRRFKINTLEEGKIDDYKAINEVVTRRYKRLMQDNLPFPNLIVIDGGKGQLDSGIKALNELNLYKKIPIISIAKREEEIYLENKIHPLKLNKKSSSLQLIQRIRDEAHRFAITYNKLLRKKEIRKK